MLVHDSVVDDSVVDDLAVVADTEHIITRVADGLLYQEQAILYRPQLGHRLGTTSFQFAAASDWNNLQQILYTICISLTFDYWMFL